MPASGRFDLVNPEPIRTDCLMFSSPILNWTIFSLCVCLMFTATTNDIKCLNCLRNREICTFFSLYTPYFHCFVQTVGHVLVSSSIAAWLNFKEKEVQFIFLRPVQVFFPNKVTKRWKINWTDKKANLILISRIFCNWKFNEKKNDSMHTLQECSVCFLIENTI